MSATTKPTTIAPYHQEAEDAQQPAQDGGEGGDDDRPVVGSVARRVTHVTMNEARPPRPRAGIANGTGSWNVPSIA
jgi:hypothetical protein